MLNRLGVLTREMDFQPSMGRGSRGLQFIAVEGGGSLFLSFNPLPIVISSGSGGSFLEEEVPQRSL